MDARRMCVECISQRGVVAKRDLSGYRPGTVRTLPKGPDVRAFEDKVLQRAVVMVLEAVYEQDFLDCSYGFRPGRSAHQALDALRRELMDVSGGWVVEVDIRKFFDTPAR